MSYYYCATCNVAFEHTEGSVAKCPECGSRAVARVELTGRHG